MSWRNASTPILRDRGVTCLQQGQNPQIPALAPTSSTIPVKQLTNYDLIQDCDRVLWVGPVTVVMF